MDEKKVEKFKWKVIIWWHKVRIFHNFSFTKNVGTPHCYFYRGKTMNAFFSFMSWTFTKWNVSQRLEENWEVSSSADISVSNSPKQKEKWTKQAAGRYNGFFLLSLHWQNSGKT